MANMIQSGDIIERQERLTERQKDCLSLVAQGYTSKEIGRLLGLSPSTIDNHILAAMQLLDAPSRGAAARKFSSAEVRQKIPSQSPSLAIPNETPRTTVSNSIVKSGSFAKFSFALPPLGGRPNDLDWADKTLRIFQVAVVGLGGFLSMALIISGAFTLLG
jgi:DNA-binding CsgD family transcriptional regulator